MNNSTDDVTTSIKSNDLFDFGVNFTTLTTTPRIKSFTTNTPPYLYEYDVHYGWMWPAFMTIVFVSVYYSLICLLEIRAARENQKHKFDMGSSVRRWKLKVKFKKKFSPLKYFASHLRKYHWTSHIWLSFWDPKRKNKGRDAFTKIICQVSVCFNLTANVCLVAAFLIEQDYQTYLIPKSIKERDTILVLKYSARTVLFLSLVACLNHVINYVTRHTKPKLSEYDTDGGKTTAGWRPFRKRLRLPYVNIYPRVPSLERINSLTDICSDGRDGEENGSASWNTAAGGGGYPFAKPRADMATKNRPIADYNSPKSIPDATESKDLPTQVLDKGVPTDRDSQTSIAFYEGNLMQRLLALGGGNVGSTPPFRVEDYMWEQDRELETFLCNYTIRRALNDPELLIKGEELSAEEWHRTESQMMAISSPKILYYATVMRDYMMTNVLRTVPFFQATCACSIWLWQLVDACHDETGKDKVTPTEDRLKDITDRLTTEPTTTSATPTVRGGKRGGAEESSEEGADDLEREDEGCGKIRVIERGEDGAGKKIVTIEIGEKKERSGGGKGKRPKLPTKSILKAPTPKSQGVGGADKKGRRAVYIPSKTCQTGKGGGPDERERAGVDPGVRANHRVSEGGEEIKSLFKQIEFPHVTYKFILGYCFLSAHFSLFATCYVAKGWIFTKGILWVILLLLSLLFEMIILESFLILACVTFKTLVKACDSCITNTKSNKSAYKPTRGQRRGLEVRKSNFVQSFMPTKDTEKLANDMAMQRRR